MSVYYEVREHVVLKNDASEEIKDSVVEAIAQIGYRMLWGHAAIWKLALKADEKEYSFAGSEITPGLHEIIRVIEDAQTIDLVMDYDGVNIEFPIAESVKEPLENHPACEDDLFYSLYNKADCESGAGILSAYGEKNGKIYCGSIDLCPASFVEGEWYNEDTLATFEADLDDALNLDNLKNCVDGLSAVGAGVDFSVGKKDVSLFVNNITIKTTEEFERFVKLCIELDRATDGKCGFMLEFVDTTSTDARILQIELGNNGTYSVWMANV